VETLEDRTLLSATAFSPATLLSLLPQGATLVPGIVVADFTGDGKPDVAAGFTNGNAYPNDPAQIAVFPGIGGGMFGAPQTFDAGTGSGGGSLATGDFNNDGHPDLVLTAGESNGNSFGNKVSINLGNGAGGFAAPIVFATGGSDLQVVVADFNEDHNADLAIYTRDSGNLALHFGDGTGHFSSATNLSVAQPNQEIGQLVAADLNGDGHTDLAVPVEGGSNQVKLYFGNGSGSFTAGQVLSLGIDPGNVPLGMVAGDFDENGQPDLAVSAGDKVYVFQATGGGNFAQASPAHQALPIGDAGGTMDAADFDGDGHLDLAVGNYTGQVVALLRGDGQGNLASPESYAVPGGSGYDLRAADVNGDGRPDIVATSMNNPQPGVSVLINQTAVTPGLVAWWTGDDTGQDASGHGHDATLNNGVGYTPAVVNDGFQFDGVDDYLLVPDSPDLRFANSFTIEGWIRVDKLPPSGYASTIINKDSQLSGNRAYSFGVTSDGRLYTEAFGDGTDGSAAIRHSATAVPVGSFADVAVVYDGPTGRLDLYINGQLSDGTLVLNSGSFPSSLYTSTEPVQIGAYRQASFANDFSAMAIDELKMYNQALSSADIQASYNDQVPANAAPTANPGGPYTTTYGSGLTLDGSASTDPDSDPITYTWTVNGQPLPSTNAATQTLTWADLQALGVTTAGSYTVRLTVDDGHGGVNTSAETALTVNKADQTIDFEGLADKTYGDGPITLSGTGGGSGNPVTFSVTGPASLGTDGVTLKITGAGTVIVTASQAGDGNYNPAPSVERSFNVAKYTPTGSIVAVPAATYSGTAHGTTGSVLGVGGTVLSSTVVYTDASGTVVAAPVNAGSYTATVSFAGDDNYTAQSFLTPIVITQATPTVTVTGGTFTYDGQPHPATGSVAGVNGENLGSPTFIYAYTDNNGNIVTSSTAPTESGYYTVTASFAGNGNYESASATATITIALEAQTLTDLNKALHAGRTIPIKLQLLDANGNNLSSSSIALTAIRLDRVNADGTQTQVALQDAGNADPDNLFRYDAALNGYIFNLNTKGLSAGTYDFYWMADGDPTEHELGFQLV